MGSEFAIYSSRKGRKGRGLASLVILVESLEMAKLWAEYCSRECKKRLFYDIIEEAIDRDVIFHEIYHVGETYGKL